MKAIIVEHQEERGEICNINNTDFFPEDTTSKSPVYSECDEDRTQFTQIIINSVNKTQKETVEIIDLCDIDDDDDVIHNTITNTAVNDSSTITNVEIDLHRAISNLSIIEDPLQITTSDANCSQNILNNFENVEKIIKKSEGTKKVQATNEYNTDKLIKITRKNNLFSKIPEIPSITTEPVKLQSITARNLVTDKVVRSNREPIDVIKTSNYNVTKASNQIVETKTLNTNQIPEIQYSDKICPVNNTSNILKDSVYSTQFNPVENSKSITATINVDNPLNNACNMQNERPKNNPNEISRTKTNKDRSNATNNSAPIDKDICIVTKKKRGPRKKKIEVVKDIKSKNKISYRTPKPLNENSNFTNVPIYNTNVENDLSWLENIRFVREIRDDEKDTKLNFDESFWDNYHLPVNWNENEFV